MDNEFTVRQCIQSHATGIAVSADGSTIVLADGKSASVYARRAETAQPGDIYRKHRRRLIEDQLAVLENAAAHWERAPGRAPGQDRTGAEIAAEQRKEIAALRADLTAVDAEQF